MDWLDQYLNELNRPGTVVHLPPDKQSWHAPVPTKQQLSLIQDATIADMVRMRNIQEARQAEMDAGMGGGYDAGSAAKERATVSPVAPAGIPVASTASITIAGNIALNGTYTRVPQGTEIMNTEFTGEPDTFVLNGGTFLYRKPNSSYGIYTYENYTIFSPNSIIKAGGGSGSAVAGTPFSTWTIGSMLYDEGSWITLPEYLSTNPSTDPTTIPTTGWTGYFGSFTITAA